VKGQEATSGEKWFPSVGISDVKVGSIVYVPYGGADDDPTWLHLGKVVFKGEKESKAVLRINFTNSGEIMGEEDPDMYDDIVDDDGYVYLVVEDPDQDSKAGAGARELILANQTISLYRASTARGLYRQRKCSQPTCLQMSTRCAKRVRFLMSWVKKPMTRS
jgi:hypothetical protein